MVTRRLGALVLAVIVAVLVPAGAASAHAELLEVSPADGAVLAEAPPEAVLRFSEQVSLTGGSATVLDDTGATVSRARRGRRRQRRHPPRRRPRRRDLHDRLERDLLRLAPHQRGVGVPRRRALRRRAGRRSSAAPRAGWGDPARRLGPDRRRLRRRARQRRRLVVHDAGHPWRPPTRGGRWSSTGPRSSPRSALIAAIPMRIARLGGGIERAPRRRPALGVVARADRRLDRRDRRRRCWR